MTGDASIVWDNKCGPTPVILTEIFYIALSVPNVGFSLLARF